MGLFSRIGEPVEPRVIVKAGREKPILHGHPWVFSGAVASTDGSPRDGAAVDVLTADGRWVGRGLYHSSASLRVRLFSWNREAGIDAELFRGRVRQAVAYRRALFANVPESVTNAYRLIYSEADGISGLIVDRYADLLVVEWGAAGLLPFAEAILDELRRTTGVANIVSRATEDAVSREGLDREQCAALSSTPEIQARIVQDQYAFQVDVGGGQKTGFFLDQRVNRGRVASFAGGRRVLSAFCYTGAFEVYCAGAGASGVLGIDSSQPAIDRAISHALANQLPPPTYVRGAVPHVLRELKERKERFDLVILDPPKFVSRRDQKSKGMRAYKDINRLGLDLLSPGGILASFSCSGQVSSDDFLATLNWAATDAGRELRIMELLGQAPDHPVTPNFPESSYLKGVLAWAI